LRTKQKHHGTEKKEHVTGERWPEDWEVNHRLPGGGGPQAETKQGEAQKEAFE